MQKNVILIIITVFLHGSEPVLAQVKFTRVFGGSGYDFGAEVLQTPDDGFLIAGSTGSFGLDNGQVILMKTDSEGYLEWRRFYGDEYADQATSMQMTSDGNLIIAGNTETSENSYQMYALKMTVDGDTIWTRKYGGPAWDFCRQVVALSDGGFALFGQTFQSGQGDFSLVRINSDGDELWSKTYGGPQLESGESIANVTGGGFYLAGHTESFGEGMTDMYVVKTNVDGDTLWTKTFGGSLEDHCYSVAESIDMGYILAGSTQNNTPGIADMVVRKEDAADTWVTYESRGSNASFTDVLVESGSGNVTVVGYYEGGGFGKEDARILRYGNLGGVWNGVARSHGSQENDRFLDVKQCSDMGYVMVGYTQGYLNRFDDIYLVKAGNDGIAANPELGIDEINLNNETYSLSVGPNPFHGSSISFFVKEFQAIQMLVDDRIDLKVYDSSGHLVHTQQINSDQTNLQLDVSSGFYSYQLVTSNVMLATGKLIKLD